MIRFIVMFIFMCGCSNNKWYRVTCNKNKGGTALDKEMLLNHLDKVGFSCNNNGANISVIKNKKIIEALDIMKDSRE